MRQLIILIFLFNWEIGISQNGIPFYEQIAFDFYRTNILSRNQVNERISIYKEIEPYEITKNPYWYPRCLEKFDIKEFDNSDYNISGKLELNFDSIDQSRFKIKKYGRGRYPRLFVSQSLQMDPNRILVILTEVYKWRGNIYYIELNNKGIITNWCKSGYIE